MGQPTDRHLDDFFAELDQLGEKEVRNRVALGAYASKRLPWVEEWLRRIEDERNDASQSEQIEIARSAKDAAWEAALAARDANRQAKRANVIAIIALAAAIAAIILPLVLPASDP